MPEYTYLLETRLSNSQKNAVQQIREVAREAGMTVFLSGGAIRDLTTGSSVRDLDFTVQGNALDLEAGLIARGGELWGRVEETRTLFLWFPGSVRVEIASARTEKYPKPGKPEYAWGGIIDDLMRRDFTANAMALSLNEGSFGLLLDPLNGVADIEARQLRLVSNYGFIEDPSRLIRAVRLLFRLGWQMEERTATRFENAREADAFDVILPSLRGYELEKIAAEEEAFGVLKALEAGGWMQKLFPEWTTASVDMAALENLQKNRIQLLMQGIVADLTAVHLEVLTAKMKPEAREQLKAALVRPGLRQHWENLQNDAKEFGRKLTSKEAARASESWKLFHSSPAEPILWLAHTRKGAALDAKFKDLINIWPELAKKVPVALMLEMRIHPELPNYAEILHAMFLKQIDGELETEDQLRAFLDPYSPPAPPPPVTLKRTRGKKAEKGKKKSAARDVDDDEDEDDDEDSPRNPYADEDEDEDEQEEEEDFGKLNLNVDDSDDLEEDTDDTDDEKSKPRQTASAKPKASVKAEPVAKTKASAAKAEPKSAVAAKPVAKAPQIVAVPAKAVPKPPVAVKPVEAAAPAKKAVAKAVEPAKKVTAAKPEEKKTAEKVPEKAVKAPAKAVAKAPAKKTGKH